MSTAADTFLMTSVYRFIFFTAAWPTVARVRVMAPISPLTTPASTPSTIAPAAGPPITVAFRIAAIKGGATHPNPAAPYPTPYENSFPWTVVAAFGVHLGNIRWRSARNGFTSQLYWIAVNITIPMRMRRPPTIAWRGGMTATAAAPMRTRTPAMIPDTRMIPREERGPEGTARLFDIRAASF